MPLVLEVFDHKPKDWTNLNFDLTALDVQCYCNLSGGDMNVCIRLHRNPSNSCQDVLHKTTNVNLMVAPEEKSSMLVGYITLAP